MLSWCDKLASTPSVGFKLDPHHASSDSIIDAIAGILDPLHTGEKPKFSVLQQASFELQFQTEDGFIYAIDPIKTSVAFRHRMRARPTSGGPPIMEMLSKPAPYTSLLRDVSKRLVELTTLVPTAKSRTVRRTGVVSTTSIGQDELPPGIARFIESVGQPWQNLLDHYSITVAAEVGKGQAWRDRCIHNIIKSDDPDQLMTLTFDWQRVFTSGYPIQKESLTQNLERCQKAALEYFEDLAEGRRFDAELAKKTARV
jgi:hypothetical protein